MDFRQGAYVAAGQQRRRSTRAHAGSKGLRGKRLARIYRRNMAQAFQARARKFLYQRFGGATRPYRRAGRMDCCSISPAV
jgi:hypothetical protein